MSAPASPAPTPPVGGQMPPAPRNALFTRALSFVGELVHVVLISLAIIVPVRYFLIQPFYVKGASMEPNFLDREYLIIDEISYRFHEPSRGDIIVFRYPNDPRQYFIKRIVALPGERVEIRDGLVFITDVSGERGLLDEGAYLSDAPTVGTKDVLLGEDEFYLLGDNRSASLDSRTFGPIPRRYFIGKVWLRGWPPERIRVFTADDHLAPHLIPESL